MRQNKRIAVTGGIGSGKSALCEAIRKKGYPVFSCDAIYGELSRTEEFLQGLRNLFPDCVSAEELNRKALSALVFSNESARKKLNEYTHPRIMDELFSRMDAFPIAFAEVPLLYEEGLEGGFDAVIALKRAKDVRLRSVTVRDGLSETEIFRRMERQFDPERLSEKNCYILENDGSLSDLEEKAEDVLNQIIKR